MASKTPFRQNLNFGTVFFGYEPVILFPADEANALRCQAR